jgi:hypothetical protein
MGLKTHKELLLSVGIAPFGSLEREVEARFENAKRFQISQKIIF